MNSKAFFAICQSVGLFIILFYLYGYEINGFLFFFKYVVAAFLIYHIYYTAKDKDFYRTENIGFQSMHLKGEVYLTSGSVAIGLILIY